MFKKITLLLASSILATAVQAVPVASYNALSEVTFNVTSGPANVDDLLISIDSELIDSLQDSTGSGVANAGSNSSDVFDTSATSFTWDAFVNGSVEAPVGFSDAFAVVDGFLSLTNNSTSIVEFEFVINLTNGIFTDDDMTDSAIAFAAALIDNDITGSNLFDDFIELDSVMDGEGDLPGSLGPITISQTLGAGESVDYFIALDVNGTAETDRPDIPPPTGVPTPGTLALLVIGMCGLACNRRRLFSRGK